MEEKHIIYKVHVQYTFKVQVGYPQDLCSCKFSLLVHSGGRSLQALDFTHGCSITALRESLSTGLWRSNWLIRLFAPSDMLG